MDIDFKKLQDVVLQALINKPIPLTGAELRFIRKFLELPTAAFGKLFGVSHVAVIKWENDKLKLILPQNYVYVYTSWIISLQKIRNLENSIMT